MMFELARHFWRKPVLSDLLSRLNRTLFLMLIDSTSLAAPRSPGNPVFNITSNFFRPNQ